MTDESPTDMDAVIIRSLQGRATAQEQEELRVWMHAEPAHAGRYEELRKVWALVGVVDPIRPYEEIPNARWLVRRAEAAAPTKARTTGDGGMGHGPGDEPRGRARSPRISARGTARSWRRPAAGLALAAGLAAVAFATGLLLDGEGDPGPWDGGVLRTAAGQGAVMELAQGSSVRVGPDSRLELEEVESETVARLDGRAFFSVTDEDSRSFRVVTPEGEATVLGTRFEVRSEAGEFRVVVTDGSVRVASGEDEVELGEGEMSRSVAGGPLTREVPEDLAVLLDWLDDVLVFRATPLEEVLAEFERRYGVEAVLLDEGLQEMTITATFADEPWEEVGQVLCELIAATCVVEDDTLRVGG